MNTAQEIPGKSVKVDKYYLILKGIVLTEA
jgi:hypothetical protein